MEPNQDDVLLMASRLVAKKKLAQEAHQANADAETAANDAAKNAEHAAKLAQTAAAEQAGLVEEIRLAVEAGQNAIRTTREAEIANAPLGLIGNAPAQPGPAVNLPAQVAQIPTMAPIIHAVIPEIVPCGGLTASGEPLLGPREAARLVVEQEHVRALKYQED